MVNNPLPRAGPLKKVGTVGSSSLKGGSSCGLHTGQLTSLTRASAMRSHRAARLLYPS